jgi:hypothetical protein
MQEKHSAIKREHPAQHEIYSHFLFLWLLFALLDPNSAYQHKCGSGTRNAAYGYPKYLHEGVGKSLLYEVEIEKKKKMTSQEMPIITS